jgi:hypothetical protein
MYARHEYGQLFPPGDGMLLSRLILHLVKQRQSATIEAGFNFATELRRYVYMRQLARTRFAIPRLLGTVRALQRT